MKDGEEISMRIKLYNILVNRIPGISYRYHKAHDGRGGTGKVLSWLYLLWLNFCYYCLFFHALGALPDTGFCEARQLPTKAGRSPLSWMKWNVRQRGRAGREWVSVVIPLYNQEENIAACVGSLRKQTFGFRRIEIVLINDGSTDKSGEICRALAKKYPNIIYLEQKNCGVSAARNLGIRHATGKYIFYLDADDQLAPDTVKKVTGFFDSVYEETDLVTYPMDTIYGGEVLPPHFRYKFLKASGVYDLRTSPYIGQTTMNIAVKNRFEQNILFSEKQNFSEDQRYCCDILGEKLTMGFCRDGKYIYYRNPSGSSGKLSGACYIFEQCMDFFERLFEQYEHVPLAFQGLFVNDIYWKLTSNILLPYHYGAQAYAAAVGRIRMLLKKCESSVILYHPAIDFFEKYYLLRLRDETGVIPEVTDEAFSLYCEGRLVCRETSMEMVLTKVAVQDRMIRIQGFLKSVFFQFGRCGCRLYAVENRGAVRRELPLSPSAHNYYLSHEPTQRFLACDYSCLADELEDLRFEIELDEHVFPVHYYFMPLVPFSHKLKKYRYWQNEVQIDFEATNIFRFKRIAQLPKTEIWLYYDCVGVACDNGKLQFLHDLRQRDGISRFYVITDERQRANIPADCCVQFGSQEHKRLLSEADQVITAYIEENNIYPYPAEEYEQHADQFRFEITYLQHGVLHIRMPWKYSRERIRADHIVVSTIREAQLFADNGFEDSVLWKTRMPRFQSPAARLHHSQKKILFAPSWRLYLVGAYHEGHWQAQAEKMVESTFFQRVLEVLRSCRLRELLETYGYQMEVKLHPIFRNYRSLFPGDDQTVRFVDATDRPENYSLFITDFSSYLYDFVYQHVPVISFIPDYDEFRCGMNGYWDLNYPPEFWDDVSRTSEELVEVVARFLVGGQVNQIDDVFFQCDDPMGQIYRNLMKTGHERQ